jgi:PAS domain S-box-containing protein
VPLRVLLVEDSEDDALIVLRELRRGGYEPEYERVETAEAMKKALAGSVSWDVIISDYHMPLFEAPEALAVARETVPETPFVVVSGKIGEEVAVEMMKAGAHDYVMKHNLACLCATVERGLKEAEERRERRRAEKKLRRRDAILEAVRFAAERFLSEATSWEQSIEEVLERLGVATEASRVYIFENYTGEDGELWSTRRYEWLAPGVSAQMDNPFMEAIPHRATGYGRWVKILERGDLVYGHTREFPEHEQPELRKQEILSIAIVPIFVEGRWWGTIGFDECVEEREWPATEMGALKAAAGTLGAAIQRRRTEEELRGSEERYRAVIEQATDGIFLLDAGTKRLLESNSSYQKLLGYTAEELQGMEIYDLVAHPRENVDSMIQRTLEERRRLVGERTYRRKDGTLVDVEVGVSVIFYGGREVICTIVRDIAERKRAEEVVRQSEELYRAVVEQAAENIFLVDVDTRRILQFNAAFQQLLGYTAEELQQTTLYDVVAHDRESIDRNIRRILAEGRYSVGERRYRRKDGSLVDAEINVSTISYRGRRAMCIVSRDVTERKRAEEKLRASEAGLANAQRIAHLGNWEWDLVSNEAYWSDELYRIHGFAPQEFAPSWELFMRYVHPADKERIEKSLHDVLHERKPYDVEHRIFRPDGSERIVHCQLEPTFDESGQAVRAIGTVHDITERKRAEEKLRASEAELRAVFGAIDDVIFVLDGRGRHLAVAPTNTALNRRPPADVVGKTLHDVFPKEVADKVLGNIRRALETRQTVDMEHSLQFGDRQRWFATTISPMLEDSIVAVVRDITERKKDEEDLKESEERFKGLAEATFEGVAITQGGKIVETNAAFAAMFGYEPAEVIGMTPLDVTAPESHEAVRKARSSRLEEPYEAVSLRKDGTTFDTEIRGKTSFYKGSPARVTAIRDITERKMNEEALKESERLYRTVIEQASENICLVDVETGRIVESNSAFQNTLGYTEEELRWTRLYDIVAHDRESVDENIRRTLEQGRRFVGQRRYRRKDSSFIDVEVSASTILRDGRETLCIVAHDVSERARALRMLEERVAALSRVASKLTLDAPVEETLRALAESVIGASTATTYLVVLTDGGADELRLVGSHGLPAGYYEGLRAIFEAGIRSPVHEAVLAREPTVMRDAHRMILNEPLYSPLHPFADEVPENTIHILPLVVRGRAIGAICFGYLPGREPTEDEQAFLGAVADQTAVAVENSRLFAEARGKAALKERQKLARELHDSVSQALYGIALGTKTARTLLERDPKDAAAGPLEYVISLAEAGMAEMRALIFELRPESLETEGLVAALEKQAAALAARHEIEVEAALCDEPEASLEAKEAVYRIAQEALHNTVKHARPTNVGIKMACGPERITLEVYDDGLGFDAQSDFPGHLGLRSMRERTSSLGGTLEVTSVPGKGTRIYASIPL